MNLSVYNLGLIEYRKALEMQHAFLKRRQDNEIDDTLVLLEHPPVITLGRRGSENDILISRDLLEKSGIAVCEIERGGEATYHGPGQIVGYMFISLLNHEKDIRRFIHNIEEVFIRLLRRDFGITAGRDEEHIGVWVGSKKITAIGIAIRKTVTMHGFAFNVNTDLRHFNWIVPCGIKDRGVTSLQELTGGKELELQTIKQSVISSFCEVFGYTPEEKTYES